MRIAKVVGTVTLNRCHPSFQGARLKLVIPQSFDNLVNDTTEQLDALVAWDELGSGSGSPVAIAEGPEASQPFRPDLKPVDCYLSAILDHLSFDPAATARITKSTS